jgi:hypothetical protein
MAAKFTTLTHKIAIQLHLVAEIFTICSSHFRRPVRKLLDTPSYTQVYEPDVTETTIENCVFGLYPSSGISRTNKTEENKIIDKRTQYTRPQTNHNG